MKIDVLGVEYKIYDRTERQDAYLKKCDGYCDKTTHIIVIKKKPDDCELGDFERYRRKVMRHEIIHAFLFESGLAENLQYSEWGHDEMIVDWIAIQYPKMAKTFMRAGCLED